MEERGWKKGSSEMRARAVREMKMGKVSGGEENVFRTNGRTSSETCGSLDVMLRLVREQHACFVQLVDEQLDCEGELSSAMYARA